MTSTWLKEMLLWSWQSLLLVVLMLLLTRVLRSKSASVRHAFWLLGLLMIAMLPLANTAVELLPITTSPVTTIALAPVTDLAGETILAESQIATSWREAVPAALFTLWIAGFAVSAARVGIDYFRLRRIRSRGRIVALDGSLPIVYSSSVNTPMLAGFFRPVILFPESLHDWTTAEEQHAIVAHERAHFARGDHWTSLLQATLGSVFFFHPAVRYALKQLAMERELACDEHVLASGTEPQLYAEVILKVAERMIGKQMDCPAFGPSQADLQRRIEMILEYRFSKTSGGWYRTTLKAAVVALLAVLLLPERAVIAQLQSPQFQGAVGIALGPVQPPASESPNVVMRLQQAPAAPTAAQTSTGRVSGTVYDQTGAVIPGVLITLAGEQKQQRDTVTNVSGAFNFTQIDPGKYTLQWHLPGFQTSRRDLTIEGNSTTNLDVLLPLGRIETSVYVSASKPVGQPAVQPATETRRLPVRVGGDVAQANLIFAPKPIYPPLARQNQIQGVVKLQAVIGKDGSVLSVLPDADSSGSPQLISAAIDAVKQWRYRPQLLNGSPIDIQTTITVEFQLVD